MFELQFADGVLARIHARGGKQFDEKAYLFVLAAVEYLQGKFEVRRHVSGVELAWACRDLAQERFGLLARHVLSCWNVSSTADFGAIVYTLVGIELLATQAGDAESDFADVYDFGEAFDETYQIKAVPSS